jgi:outer membrane protein assembly factor BamB
MRGRLAIIAGAILLALAGQHAHAVITAASPLKKFEGDAVFIVVGKVEKHFPDMPAMLVVITEDIKGKAPFRKMPINCKVADPKTFKDNQIEPLLKRFGPDQEIIFFFDPNGKSYVTFAFTNGTWFQLQGKQPGNDKSEVVFSLKSAEPYLRKTFKGTTEDLRKLLKDHIDKKTKLPDLDEKVTPGFGPEYTPKKGADLRNPAYGGGGPLFGVIPTLGVGAPLAILALLFPTVFGGVFVLFRQWMAFITVISLNSMLVFLNIWLGPKFRSSWWSTDAALWIVMTGITLACLFWAWRRQLNALASGEPEAPRRTELLILLFMAVSCIAATVATWLMTEKVSWSDAGWTLTVVLALSVFGGTLYRAYHALFKDDRLFASPPMTTEGVILGTMMLGMVAFIPAIWGANISTGGLGQGVEQSGNISAEVAPVVEKGTFTVDPRFKGMYASTPVIDGDTIYAAYYRTNGYSTLVKLDRHTLKPEWEFFGKDDDLRQMISTPCLAHGRLYFGEGFHYDKNCHVFCVDAKNGEEIWRFRTAGQTESSPAVVNGKVYIGAGNDGVYCLDAEKGKKIWRFPHDDAGMKTRVAAGMRILRFGGGMVIAGNRLYCATGVDRETTIDKCESAVFCLDASTGEEIWRTPAPYAVWSTPILKDGKLFITSGNGDVYENAKAPEIPGGAIQCLNAEDGKELWSKPFENGVIESPAVDAHRIYLGCRNGTLYCLRRSDGAELWERFLEPSPLIASPVLDSDPVYERTLSVFVATTGGKVFCLTPQKGDDVWTFRPNEPCTFSTPPRIVVTRTTTGYRRRLYVGCGLGGGPINQLENRPVLYYLEDSVRVE